MVYGVLSLILGFCLWCVLHTIQHLNRYDMHLRFEIFGWRLNFRFKFVTRHRFCRTRITSKEIVDRSNEHANGDGVDDENHPLAPPYHLLHPLVRLNSVGPARIRSRSKIRSILRLQLGRSKNKLSHAMSIGRRCRVPAQSKRSRAILLPRRRVL